MKESGVLEKTALVFGQMNEQAGIAYACNEKPVLLWQNISVIRNTGMYFFLLIIFFVLYRLVLRYLHFLGPYAFRSRLSAYSFYRNGRASGAYCFYSLVL